MYCILFVDLFVLNTLPFESLGSVTFLCCSFELEKSGKNKYYSFHKNIKLKIGVMMLKIQLCHHRSKLHFKIYSNRAVIFTILLCFSSDKCSLGEHRDFFC